MDDNAEDRQAVIDALRREAAALDGIEADVLEVGTVSGAREAIGHEEFSCIFLDHDLPDGTSLDLLMEARSQGLATPIVVLTGERDEQTIMEVMRAGAVDYLPKERLHPDLVARSLRAALLFRQAQREKQATLDELRARDRAIAAAPNGIVIADPQQPDCPLVYVNEAFLRMTGYTEAEVLGRNCRFLQGEETDPGAVRRLREAVRHERPCQVSVLNYRRDGATFWNEVTVSPVRDAQGTLTHFVGVQTDITARHEADTKRRRAEEELERLLAEAEERGRREALLNRIGEAIRTTTDPEEIQQVAVNALGEALHTDRCYFSFYDLAADSNWVGQDFRRDDLPSLAGRYRISDFQVNPEDYYPSGRTLVIADATADDWSFPEVLLSALRALRVRSVMTVPIFDGGRLVATLSVAMADEPRAWTADEVGIAEIVAAQTRSAVEAALLLGEQQAHLQEEALVGRIGVAIRRELDPEVIQETAAQLLGETLGVHRCFYLTYDLPRDSATVGRDFRRPDLPPLAGEYRLSDFQQMLAEVFADGTTASIPDVRTALSPAVAQAMDPFGHRAVLAVPFFDEGRLVAALWASARDTRAWTAHEASLMEQAATLTRTALDMARISRKEHAIAQQLQDALQPAVPEHVLGLSVGKYTKASLEESEVGGDFFDVFPLDKELYAIVIGDVSGKGLAAAQQLALIRNSLRTTLYLYRAPAEAVTALNTIVTAHDLLVGFVTAFVGVYDAALGKIEYCSCGHEPGLVRRAGGSVEALETTGPPLGVAESADYSELTITLSSGDTLLLYTDGLSEAGPSRRQLLGTEGLMRLLGALSLSQEAQADAEALVRKVSDYAGGGFRDDVAVLLARRA